MQFIRLRVSGFKSFVEPTELYVEKGLTGVVGPNGCGKSNLLEALRWVMGETKPTNIRGESMDDVIFSGTATRPPRNLAEVSLLLDNRDRTAPAAFNDEEQIEISRRIERDGGSAYRMNGKETRARDVQLLFADMATGAHSPSLVSQGRIGELISAKPRDRAALLEEAAGVAGLHSRRHEAELRLSAAGTNLERLQDVMVQIEGQLAALKRQSRQAARYKSLSGRLRAADALMFHLRWLHAQEALEETTAAMGVAESLVAERTTTNAAASTAQASANAKVPPLRQAEAERAAALHRLTVAQENLSAEEERTSREIAQLRSRHSQIEQDETRERELAKDAQAHSARLEEEREDLHQEDNAHQHKLDEAERGLERQIDETREAEEKANAAAEDFAALAAERESLTRQITDLQTQAEALVERLASARHQHDELSEITRQNPKAIAAAEKVTEAREKAEAAETSLSQATALAAETTEAAIAARQAYENVRDVLATLTAEENALGDLLAVAASGGVPVLDDITVAPGFEAALGAALGDDLSLAQDDDAPAFWADLGALDSTASLPAGAEPFETYIKAPTVLDRVLSQIGLVASGDGAAIQPLLKPGQVVVSKEGDAWRWDGKIVRAGAQSTAAVRLEQRNRLNAIRIEIAKNDGGVSRAETVWRTAQDRARDAAEKETQGRRNLSEAQDAFIAARNLETDIAQADAENISRIQALDETLAHLTEDQGSCASRLAAAQAALDAAPDPAAHQDQLVNSRRKLVVEQEKLAEARQERDVLQKDAGRRQQRLQATGAELEGWHQRLSGANGQLSHLEERKRQTGEELDALKDKPRALEDKRKSLALELEGSEQTRSQAASALAEAESELAGCDRTLNQTQSVLGEARENRVRAEGALEAANDRLSELRARIVEELECAPDETLELSGHREGSPLPEMEEISKKLERLRRERDTMGPVNLRAEQEAEEIGEQLTTMANEKEDLEAAIGRLRQAIGSLNREGRERLNKAFTEVNQHFGELFTQLFGGGSAHLALTESDDPLEAGLEVMASPPGKRLQSMTLLSGGEQALTALSLIFAVFMTNPAPICVLDEVDAPLDDANVERFCQLLHDISAKTETRFLVVTHHPITMSNMHRLFGITMSERGVSQLVSVDLGQAEELIAAE